MPDTPINPATTPSSTPANKITRGHSCLVCQQRKVKCDGQRPCLTCSKNGVDCVTKPPAQPRRRKDRQAPRQDVLSRIQNLERELLITKSEEKDSTGSTPTLGTTNPEPTPTASSSRSPKKNSDGVMVQEGEHSRYVENNLWASLKNELQTPNPAQHPNEYAIRPGEGVIFGRSASDTSLTPFHPSAVQIFKLWQTFLDNVNPVVKFFHAPTTQQMILEAIADLEKISASTEVVMFSIYFSAIISMSEAACQTSFGESRAVLVDKYAQYTEIALSNARFLKSYDIAVLQAFTLFLLAMRQQHDSQSSWLLAGIAVRSGQRIGLHRETASQGFSVLNAEIRRRLWWQISILDSIAAKRSGAAFQATFQMLSDTKKPLNVNDSDLWPSMREPPQEHTGPTEMLFIRIRCDIGEFMIQSRLASTSSNSACLDGQVPVGSTMGNNETSTEKKDRSINELESHLESRYLRYCDPSIPIHRLSMFLAKSVIAQFRLSAHHPFQYPDGGARIPQQEKDMLIANALLILELHNAANALPELQGFLWHINVVFPFEAFIYTLREMKHEKDRDLVARARNLVEKVYEFHPELITESGNALYFAVGTLAISAWRSTSIAERSSQGQFPHRVPAFITKLESQRKGKGASAEQPSIMADDISNQPTADQLYPPPAQGYTVGSGMGQNFFQTSVTMDNAAEMDWQYWQALLEGPEDAMLYANDFQNLQ
ncbi:hypothetical protein BP5796_03731 [Coleophoma crateriformis]|uniref:Zn(2)-C6 fungal-type domain-containing protein n=1 Tax=Coleophoma crateriformis TaxID=565419 RepID=A0A3D8SGH6_9HELO|nr:hypothetical protein BP5796_03731 [Coleophoma crateriformis]